MRFKKVYKGFSVQKVWEMVGSVETSEGKQLLRESTDVLVMS